MLVRRREHEKKKNGTDEGWPLTATAIAIDNPLETLPRSRPCNRIDMSVKSVVNELRGEEDLPEERALGSSTTLAREGTSRRMRMLANEEFDELRSEEA